MLPGEHYETRVLFVIYFVLKLFTNIDFYIKTKCTRAVRIFSIARILSSNSVCMPKSSFIAEQKFCKVYMKLLLNVMLITGHNNSDMMYLGAGNPSINCR